MSKTQVSIENGDFSPPFVARPDPEAGGPPVGEVTVASGWQPYYTPQGASDPPWKHRRPEWTRYLGFQKVFGTSGTIQAGVYQRVAVEVGDLLTLVVRACFTSMRGGVALRVGIDPYGGTDFRSEEILWGGWQGETAPKDSAAYWAGGLEDPRYLSVENVEAESPYVTLFLHIENLYAGKDESAFWDSVMLYKEGDPETKPVPCGDVIDVLKEIRDILKGIEQRL
jgi:hypothetical protein